MSIHQCPKCELRFNWKTELDDHCWHDHPQFRHEYPAAPVAPAAPVEGGAAASGSTGRGARAAALRRRSRPLADAGTPARLTPVRSRRRRACRAAGRPGRTSAGTSASPTPVEPLVSGDARSAAPAPAAADPSGRRRARPAALPPTAGTPRTNVGRVVQLAVEDVGPVEVLGGERAAQGQRVAAGAGPASAAAGRGVVPDRGGELGVVRPGPAVEVVRAGRRPHVVDDADLGVHVDRRAGVVLDAVDGDPVGRRPARSRSSAALRPTRFGGSATWPSWSG